MAARKPLRAVTAADIPAPTKPLTVAQAAATGNHHRLLVSMRERIARAVSDPDCPPRDLASLTRRLQDIAKEIEALELRAKEEGADASEVLGDEEWSTASL